MTVGVVTVTPTTSFDVALQQLHERRVRRFPVMDERNRLVGIVSDLFRTMTENVGAPRTRLRIAFRIEEPRGALAELTARSRGKAAIFIRQYLRRRRLEASGDRLKCQRIRRGVAAGDAARHAGDNIGRAKRVASIA